MKQPKPSSAPFKLGSLWMLVAAFFFALMGLLVKLGSEKFSPAELVFYRSLFGLLFISAIAYTRKLPLATAMLGQHMRRGVLGFVALLLFFYAISKLPLATAVTLNYTSPLFMATLSPFFLHERPRKTLFAAIFLGLVGVALLLKPTLHSDQIMAGAIALLSGLLAGIVYLHVTLLARAGEPDWRTVFYFTLISSIGSGGWMLISHFNSLTWRDLLLLLSLGLVATIAQLAMTRAYRTGNPLVVGSMSYTTVILASVFGVVLWGETLAPGQCLAVALIILSGVISVRAKPKALETNFTSR